MQIEEEVEELTYAEELSAHEEVTDDEVWFSFFIFYMLLVLNYN